MIKFNYSLQKFESCAELLTNKKKKKNSCKFNKLDFYSMKAIEYVRIKLYSLLYR